MTPSVIASLSESLLSTTRVPVTRGCRLARKRTAEERLTKQEQRQCRAEEKGRERTAKARAELRNTSERLAKRREQDRQRRARARAQKTQEESHYDGLARQSETELFEQYTGGGGRGGGILSSLLGVAKSA